MIAAAAFLLLLAQDVPADAVDGDEIVVTATIGYTTMLFDKGADGRLRNCRVMVSSGSDRRDTAACQTAPVCYAGKGGSDAAGKDCVDMVVLDPRDTAPASARPPIFDVPRLVQPRAPMAASALGPVSGAEESRESEAQRVKLPPLPKAPSDGPVVSFSVGDRRAEKAQ